MQLRQNLELTIQITSVILLKRLTKYIYYVQLVKHLQHVIL